jgi:hypothetical protein
MRNKVPLCYLKKIATTQLTREMLGVEIGAQSLVEVLPVVKFKSD